ncbi:MAG: hypothetical protein N3F67_03995 [Acidilobaceae archaeon]|nr:hypothetical protein [Acidilobaceae archaeon]
MEALEEYVVEIEHPDGKGFAELLSTLAEVLDEVALEITQEGLKASGFDPSKIAYVELEIPRSALRSISVKENMSVGLNLKALHKILNVKSGRPIVLRATHEEVELEWGEDARKIYVMPNLEVQQEAASVKVSQEARVVLVGEVLRRILRDVEAYSDMVELEADEESVTIRSPDGKVKIPIARGSSALIELEVSTPAKGIYDLSYIKKVLGLVRYMESVVLTFSSGGPLEISMRSIDGTSLRYIVAPAT